MKKQRLTSSLLTSLLLFSSAQLLAQERATESPIHHLVAQDKGANGLSCTPSLASDGVRPGRIEMRHREGGGIGYGKGYTSLDLFFAVPAANFLPFVDLRGHVFNTAKLAFNGGVGTRYLGRGRIYGAGVYYDYRQASLLKKANQIGVSVESLGTRWDFRLNGYFPFGKKESSALASGANPQFAYFARHEMFVNATQQFAMMGASGEVGCHLGKIKDVHFYSAVGPYYFTGKGKDAVGAKGRISGSYKEYIKLELSDSYDPVFHNRFQGQLTFSVPLGAKGKVKRGGACSDVVALKGLLAQPVIREEIIVEGRESFTSLALNPNNGLPYYFTFMDNTSHSDGSFESPYHDLSDALANSSPYGVIYIYPGDGTTAGLGEGDYRLQSYQQLLGAGNQQPLATTIGTVVIPPFAAQMPQLIAPAGTSLIHLASHNTISGLHLAVQGAAAPTPGDPTYAIGAREGLIDSLMVSTNVFDVKAQAVGIFVHPSETDAREAFIGGTLVLSGNQLASSDLTGSLGAILQCHNGTLASTISNNTITGFQGAKITADVDGPTGLLMLVKGSSVASITVAGNQITQNKNGLFLDCGATATGLYTVTGNTFENNSGHGAIIGNNQFEAFRLDIVFSGNSASFNGGHGVQLAGNGVVSIGAFSNQCLANGGHGISVASGGNQAFFSASLNKNSANYNSEHGIYFSSNSLGTNRFMANGNSAAYNLSSGIRVDGSSPGDTMVEVTLIGNSVENNQLGSLDLLLSCPIRLVAIGNTANGAGTYDGIGLILSSSAPSYATISSNLFQNNLESGTYIEPLNGPLELYFVGNRISATNVSPLAAGLNFVNLSSNVTATVSGNTFVGHGVGVDLGSTGNVCLKFEGNTSTCPTPYVFTNSGSGYYNITPEPLNNTPSIADPIAGVTRDGACP